MKRASDVPPVVESFGSFAVTSLIASETRSTNGPGLVTNESEFDGSHSMCQRIRPAAASPARFSISTLSEVWLCRSLNRILKRARASPGMRLTTGLAMSIEVNSRFEASYCALPWSKGAAISAPINVTLLADHDKRSIERAAPADFDCVADRRRIARLA